MHVHAGPALDLSPWLGKPINQQVLIEVTNFVMDTITHMLEEIRGEMAPVERFDLRKSDLPRIGNFKKKR